MKGFGLALMIGVAGLAALNPHTGEWLHAYKDKAIAVVVSLIPGREEPLEVNPGSCEEQAQAVTDLQFILDLAVIACVKKAADPDAARLCPRRSSKYQSAFKENVHIMCGGSS